MKNNISTEGRRKGTRVKSVSANKGSENRVPGASRNFLLEYSLSRVLHASTNSNIPLSDKTTEGNTGASYYDVHEGGVMGVIPLDRESVSVSANVLGHIDEKHVGDDKTDMVRSRRVEDELSCSDSDGITTAEVLVQTLGSDLNKFLVNDLEDAKSGSHKVQEFHKQALDNFVEDSSISSSVTGANDVDNDIKTLNLSPSLIESSLSCSLAGHVPDHPDSSTCLEFGNWKVLWDPFYNRNYFYNFKSQESTWYPPPGLEHFAFCSSMSNTNELSTDAAEEHIGIEFSCNVIQDIDIHGSHYKTSLFPEKDDLECLNHSSVEAISSRTSGNLTTDFGTTHSDEHGIHKKIADELDVSAYREKQEKYITYSEARCESDASHELCISNSLTAMINGVGNDEDKSKSPDTAVTSSMDELDCYHGTVNKKKKGVRRLQSHYTSVDDFELAKEMYALGLPISFCTTKQKNNLSTEGRRKGTRVKSVSANKGSENRENRVPGASRNFLLEYSLSRVLHASTNSNIPLSDKTTEGNTGASYYDVHEGGVMGVIPLDRESVSVSANVLGHIDEKHVGDDKTDMVRSRRVEDELSCSDSDGITTAEVLVQTLGSDLNKFLVNDIEDAKSGSHKVQEFHKQALDNFVEDSSISSSVTGANDVDNDIKTLNLSPSLIESSLSCSLAGHVPDHPDSSTCLEFGNWKVLWDPFYNRNYFYNFKSQESTWYPPPGLEHFAFCSSMSNTNELSTDAAEEHIGIEFSCNVIQDIDIHGSHYKTSLFPEKDDLECLNHSSVEAISSRTSGNLTTVFGTTHADEHGIHKKNADELVSLHTPYVVVHLEDELDVSAYREKQEKYITYSEACCESDASHELCISNSLTAMINGVGNDEDQSKSPDTVVTSSMDELDCYHGTVNKKKKGVRSLQSQLTLEGIVGDLPANIFKYWCQRYSLFSQFDSGIKMDEEGWFSVTPESIARHHASRCGSGIIIDCFTGVGGNAIQFAKMSNHVIAIDIDPQKIDYARHNAIIYGVSDCINFIKSDFFCVAPRLKGDVVFMSPPWGGPDYNKVETYDIETMLRPHDGRHLFKIARMIASKVVMFLPRNVNLNQLAELSLSVDPPWALEVEKNFLNGRLKAITAYFDNPS